MRAAQYFSTSCWPFLYAQNRTHAANHVDCSFFIDWGKPLAQNKEEYHTLCNRPKVCTMAELLSIVSKCPVSSYSYGCERLLHAIGSYKIYCCTQQADNPTVETTINIAVTRVHGASISHTESKDRPSSADKLATVNGIQKWSLCTTGQKSQIKSPISPAYTTSLHHEKSSPVASKFSDKRKSSAFRKRYGFLSIH